MRILMPGPHRYWRYLLMLLVFSYAFVLSGLVDFLGVLKSARRSEIAVGKRLAKSLNATSAEQVVSFRFGDRAGMTWLLLNQSGGVEECSALVLPKSYFADDRATRQ